MVIEKNSLSRYFANSPSFDCKASNLGVFPLIKITTYNYTILYLIQITYYAQMTIEERGIVTDANSGVAATTTEIITIIPEGG